MPALSVIVPVYNAERTLARCLDSILAQSFSDLEVICVDDGSYDRSADMLGDYAAKDARVRIIRQPNRGVGAARNAGLDAARGQWTGFVDSDDWIDCDFYAALHEAACRTGADVACTGLVSHRAKRLKRRVHYPDESLAAGAQERFEAGQCPPNFYIMNKLYRSSLIRDAAIRFPDGICEDMPFTARVFLAARSVVTVPGQEYHYMYNPGSLVASRLTPQKQRDRYLARKAVLELADKGGVRMPEGFRSVTVREWYAGPVCLLKIRERDGVRTWRLWDFLPVWRRKI